MIILYVFIIKNYPKLLSSYYHKFTFLVIYPFYDFTRSLYKLNFPENHPMVRENMVMFSLFWNHVSFINNGF